MDCLVAWRIIRGMPPPPLPNNELARFMNALKRSGLMSGDRIDAILRQAPSPILADATKLPEYFVEKGALTHFQITKLQQGTFQGLVLGHFHILSPLGKGGMSTVYLARDSRAKSEGDKKHKSLVALKILPPKRAKEEYRMLARFQREMEICQRVDHPHLTRTYEVGQASGVYYIAMEYIRGDVLRKVVTDRGPLTPTRAARIFSEVAEGLQHAHEKGLIHRDLKPSNIMVTPNGHAKVLDLGLAFDVQEVLPEDIKIVGGQGYVVGTMDYIAPEQVDSPTGVDARADIYALGCSMYFALTGRPPFPGGTSIEKMKRHRTENPEYIQDLNPTVPAELCRVIERMMEKSPEARHLTAAAVAKALRPFAANDVSTPMDVDPDQSEAEVVLELERTHKGEDAFFESIPVVVFADKRKKQVVVTPPAPPQTPPATAPVKVPPKEQAHIDDAGKATDSESTDHDEEQTPSRSRFPMWLLVVLGALFFVCLGGAVTTALVLLVRK